MVTRRAPIVAALALVVAGCGAAAAPPPASEASSRPESVAPSPSGEGTPDDKAAAASSYFSALSTYIAAVEEAGPDCATATLVAQRRCFEAASSALERFGSRIRSIDLPAEVTADVEALFVDIAILGELLAGARDEGSIDRLTSHWWPQIDPADVAVLEAADVVRVGLGLPPVTSD